MTALSGAVGLDEPARPSTAPSGAPTTAPTVPAAIWPARTHRPIWPRDGHRRASRCGSTSPATRWPASSAGRSRRWPRRQGPIDARLDYHVSSGLSRPEYFDWPQRLIDMVLETRAEAIVFLVGGNDAQDVEVGRPVARARDRGLARRSTACAWREAMDIATAGGRRVYWVGQPIMRDESTASAWRCSTGCTRRRRPAHEGVTYVDTWELFANGDGEYAAYLRDADGDLVRMRQADGIHLTRAGADRLAARVLEVVREDWGMDDGQDDASAAASGDAKPGRRTPPRPALRDPGGRRRPARRLRRRDLPRRRPRRPAPERHRQRRAPAAPGQRRRRHEPRAAQPVPEQDRSACAACAAGSRS